MPSYIIPTHFLFIPRLGRGGCPVGADTPLDTQVRGDRQTSEGDLRALPMDTCAPALQIKNHGVASRVVRKLQPYPNFNDITGEQPWIPQGRGTCGHARRDRAPEDTCRAPRTAPIGIPCPAGPGRDVESRIVYKVANKKAIICTKPSLFESKDMLIS